MHDDGNFSFIIKEIIMDKAKNFILDKLHKNEVFWYYYYYLCIYIYIILIYNILFIIIILFSSVIKLRFPKNRPTTTTLTH